MEEEKKWYKSKKFWATATGVLAVVFENYLGLDPAVTTKLVAVLSAFVVGQGIADIGKALPK